ncbi:Phage gp6-like head-tail connector protein [Labrenzia sp. THAF35]|uniref:head-tail connector protein n=1 Tax=Labrenzia sp. THAF35 TaxID=2587854 RepID=UPI001268C2D0|nr:head-tail connector protein [Labrenzia sp. THAF35]QFT69611.1 Phage gp6-like head-tail connector protein [Labrenzia sp. THAF35]
MSLRLISMDSGNLLTRDEAKEHLRVYHDDEDDYIDALLAVVTENFCGEQGWLGISVVEQVWEYTACTFPCGLLRIPRPPLKTVDNVYYTPDTDVETELLTFRTFDAEVKFRGGYILPAIDEDWPDTNGEPASVRIRFTSGYDVVPAPVKHAAKLMIGTLFDNREDVSEKKVYVVPQAIDRLLMPYRNWPG